MRALISAAFIAVIRAQTVQLRLPKLKKDWFKNKQIRPLLYFCIQIIDLLWNINPVWWETTDMGLTIRCIWELKRRKCWHFTPCSYFLLFAVDKHDHWPNVLKVQMVKADEKTLPSLHSQEEESSSSSSEEEENDQRQNEDLFGKVVMVEGVTGSDKKKPSWYPALVSGHIIFYFFLFRGVPSQRLLFKASVRSCDLIQTAGDVWRMWRMFHTCEACQSASPLCCWLRKMLKVLIC